MLGSRIGTEPAISSRRFVPQLVAHEPGSAGEELQVHAAASSRSCPHWPMNAPDGIRAASVALRDLLQLWDRAERLLPAPNRAGAAECESDGIPGHTIDVDLLLLKASLAPDAARAITLQLVELAEQFSTVTRWLMRSAQSSYDSVQRGPYQQQVLAVLRDDHRVIARDWLGADMNAAVARLLLRAARVLTSEDLSQRAIHDDLLGSRGLRVPLQAACEMLARAGVLATDCTAFVRSFDEQWLALRGEISATMALYPLGDSAPVASHQA